MVNRFILNEVSYFGPGARKKLPEEIKRLGLKKALVVSDASLVKFGVTGKVTAVLDEAGVPYEIFSDIKPNPTVTNVKNGVAAFSKSGADFIVAVGGGSSMDTAKAVGIITNNPEFADVVSLEGVANTKHKSVPIIALPTKDAESGYYIIGAGDGAGLMLALNSASAEDGAKIFLPNGTYDWGEAVQTTISGSNVSIIGQSAEGVIIKTAPDKSLEGLNSAALLANTGSNFYMQDLTLKNELDYYGAGSAGRANAFWDKGSKTICKNVRLLSYQDTYLSATDKQFYFETTSAVVATSTSRA